LPSCLVLYLSKDYRTQTRRIDASIAFAKRSGRAAKVRSRFDLHVPEPT
jgi:hypothetical protein